MLKRSNPIPKWYESINDARIKAKEKLHYKFKHLRRNPALLWKGGNDYEIKEGYSSCWIKIDNHCVYVAKTSKGIAVEIIEEEEGTGFLETKAEIGIVTQDEDAIKWPSIDGWIEEGQDDS